MLNGSRSRTSETCSNSTIDSIFRGWKQGIYTTKKELFLLFLFVAFEKGCLDILATSWRTGTATHRRSFLKFVRPAELY